MRRYVYIREIEPNSWLHLFAQENGAACLRDFRLNPPKEDRGRRLSQILKLLQTKSNHWKDAPYHSLKDVPFHRREIEKLNRSSNLTGAGPPASVPARPSRRMLPIDCAKGLHQLVGPVNQLTYMKQHSERMLEVLNIKLEHTYAVAPCRKQSYELNRKKGPRPQVRERLLEKAIWWQWRAEAVAEHDRQFFPGLCRHIQTFQMPLQGRRADKFWGKLDLVGTTETGLPIVLELKQQRAADTPLRMLIEGLAYAVAVRRAWNEGTLRNQWNSVVTIQSKQFVAPYPLLQVPIIGIAPTEYWNRCIGKPGKRTKGKVRKDAWAPFHELCDACGIRGFPVKFVQFDVEEPDTNSLPLIKNVRKVNLPK